MNAASTRIATPEKRAEILGNAIVQADELNMDSQQKAAEMAAAYLMVISTPSEEEKRQVCDLVQRVLNGVELVAALIGAFMLFFGAAIALWARVQLHRFNASDDLAAFRGVVAPFVVATLLYGTFAVFRAYNRAEIHEVTGLYPAGIKGEVFTTLLVMAVSILLAYAYFPGVASIPMITAVLSAAVTTVGWIVVKIRHQELRGVIGSGATWGNTFFVVVISVMLLAGVGIGMMVESRV